MCCEHLVCANCAQPVADAGCGVCRAARARMHPHTAVPASTLVIIAALLAIAAVLSAHLAG